MAKTVKPIPDGCRTVTPYLIIRNAAEAIEFYKKAFGATEVCCMRGPDGKSVMHAEIRIGDSLVYLGDECPDMGIRSPETLGGTTASVMLYVEDVDATFAQAVAAGAKSRMDPQNMFWGDRFGKLTDPYGHDWAVATHVEDVSAEEMERRSQAFFAEMAKKAS